MVEIVTFDSLDLHPDVIKIDVEGFEYQVLKGMAATLKNDRPILMLEKNAADRACRELLAVMDYRFLYYDLTTRRLTDAPKKKTRNWFAVPSEQVTLFCS